MKVTIGEIAQIRRGASPRPIADARWFSDDGPGWVRIGDVTAGGKYLRSTKQRLSPQGVERSVKVRRGDLLLSVAASVGVTAIVDMDACIHDGWVVLSDFEKVADREFLYYLLSRESTAIAAVGQTGSQNNINSRILREWVVSLPPLEHQKKVAQLLAAVDRAIELLTLFAHTKERFAVRVQQELLSGHRRIPASGKAGAWRECTLGDLACFVNGRAFTLEDWASSGVPIIRIQNLNGAPDFNYYQGDIEPNHRVEPGDILFAWSGNRGTSFGATRWRGPVGVLNQHIFRVVPRSGVTADFLYRVLETVTTRIESRAHGASGLVHVRKRDLEAYRVRIPAVEEQNRIAKLLELTDRESFLLRRLRDAYIAQKRALLHRLLSGDIPALDPAA